MTVDKLVKKIRTDAKRKAKNIAKRAQEKAKAEEERIISEKEKKLDELRKESERELRTLKNRIHSQAKLEARKMELKVREEMIEDVFQGSLERLKDTPPEEYSAYLRQAIGKCVNILGDDIVIECNEESLDTVKDLANKIASGLRVEPNLQAVGGIKARSKDGSYIDMTFEANLERIKKDLRKEVTEMMFKEEM